MQAALAQFRDLNVAAHGDGFGGRGHAAQAEPHRLATLAHDRAGEERGVLAMIDHRQIQRAAIVHHLAQ